MSLFAISRQYQPQVLEAISAAVEAARAAADEALAVASVEPEVWLRDMAALGLANDVADAIGEPLDQVWHSLCNVPPNLYSLLETPEGWSALAARTAFDLGHGPVSYHPQVH